MSSNLTEKQEIILCRFFDGDLGFFNRMRVSALLSRSCEARAFLENLTSISSAVNDTPNEATQQHTCDLWERISQRIGAEERASIFLGERGKASQSLSADTHTSWYSFFSTQALLGGLSGAATTALVLLVVNNYRSSPTSASQLIASHTGSASVIQANLASNGFENSRTSVAAPYSAASSGSRPLSLQGQAHSVMEVDWMRGDGPLRVIQNPSEKSTIIWVKRNNQPRKTVTRGDKATLRAQIPQVILTNAPVTNSHHTLGLGR